MVGKLIGGIIGLLTGGPVGLLLGLLVGHLFDRGLATSLRFASPENLARIKQSFFETTFTLLGALAKSDGRVSENEVEFTERIFTQMGLSAPQRQRAIDLFRQGAGTGFQLEPVVSAFLQSCGPIKPLHQTLLLYLAQLALADGAIAPKELDFLHRVARLLGFGTAQVDQLLRMVQAQDHFHGEGGFTAQPGTSLEDAYVALGVGQDATDRELKQAYRRLMSEHHPDKLIARGVPEDMVKLATEKAQEIQAAYAMIKKSRGG